MKKTNFTLPAMEHKFSIQVKGEESGINWVGDFNYRRPNLQERAMVDVMRARLNGDLRTLDPDVMAFNEALAHLRFTVKDYPEWWAESDFGGKLYDANVVLEVYNKCIEFEGEWRKKVHSGEPDDVEEGKADVAKDKKPAGASAGA